MERPKRGKAGHQDAANQRDSGSPALMMARETAAMPMRRPPQRRLQMSLLTTPIIRLVEASDDAAPDSNRTAQTTYTY
jgi:hypothetical protein